MSTKTIYTVSVSKDDNGSYRIGLKKKTETLSSKARRSMLLDTPEQQYNPQQQLKKALSSQYYKYGSSGNRTLKTVFSNPFNTRKRNQGILESKIKRFIGQYQQIQPTVDMVEFIKGKIMYYFDYSLKHFPPPGAQAQQSSRKFVNDFQQYFDTYKTILQEKFHLTSVTPEIAQIICLYIIRKLINDALREVNETDFKFKKLYTGYDYEPPQQTLQAHKNYLPWMIEFSVVKVLEFIKKKHTLCTSCNLENIQFQTSESSTEKRTGRISHIVRTSESIRRERETSNGVRGR